MRNLNNPLLLLVDDTPRDLVLLAGILGPAGYQLSLAANGHQALALAAKELPDLIIMDILMPDLGGLEVCRQLKADPATTGIPVIFLTSQADPDEIIHGFEAGAVDYVTKPFRIHELLARVHVHVEILRAHHEIRRLHGILPTCASCKKIRDEDGHWQPIEAYIAQRSEAQFSHGLCPDCAPLFFPDR